MGKKEGCCLCLCSRRAWWASGWGEERGSASVAIAEWDWLTGHYPVVHVYSLSRVGRFAAPWTAAHQASLSFTISQSLLGLISIDLVMPSNHLILCCPLLLPPSIFTSHQGLFKWVSSSHQVARVLVFQLQYQIGTESDLYFLHLKMKKLSTVSKNKTGSWL